jgi:hypothetical protein
MEIDYAGFWIIATSISVELNTLGLDKIKNSHRLG